MRVEDPRLRQMLGPATEMICSMFDTMPQALGVLWPVRDEGGAIVDFEVGFTNPAGDAMMGFAMADEVGTRLLQALPPLVEMGVFDRLIAVAETGEPVSAEIEMTGMWKGTAQVSGIYEHSVLPFGDGVLSLSHDLTEERRREAELRDFAAVAAHDLRDPLVGLQIMVSALAHRERAAGADAPATQELRRASPRGARLG